jgi:imidazolonepropionase-like amidohydrolase
MRKNKFLFPAFFVSFVMLFAGMSLFAQSTFPVNGLSNPQNNTYAFINATIVKDASQKITNATMVIRDKKIVAVGAQISIPGDAIVIDCKGKYIYPSFIDLYSDYGIAAPQQRNTGRRNPFSGYQFTSNTPGAFAWNQALKPEVNGADLFHADNEAAGTWRNAGFGTVLTHQHDGIARGTGTLVTLANQTDNLVMLKEKASAQYSFSKGSSTQSYPSSLMGVIALLRQSYLDAAWYKSLPSEEGKNLSLEAWNQEQDLPQIFEANDKWNCLRASRIGNEFGVKYILKAGGNEYQRIKEMAATQSPFIVPLNFPEAMDVSDPNTVRYVSLSDMENWEQAPGNPAAFEKAHIPFCLTADGLKDAKSFMANLRKAINAGLSEKTALEALTRNPATLLNVYDMTGSLEAGKLANFIITSAPVFDEKSVILQNWIQGEKYGVNESEWNPVSATYDLAVTSSEGGTKNYILNVKSLRSASVISTDTLSTQFSFDGKLVQIVFSPAVSPKRRKDLKKEMPVRDTAAHQKMNPQAGQNADSLAKAQDTGDDQKPETQRPQRLPRAGARSMPGGIAGPTIRLSGVSNGDNWQGNGLDTSGAMLYWTATLVKENTPKEDTSKEEKEMAKGTIDYPFGAYGWKTMPAQHDLLIKNATVWTSEKEGILKNTDVLVKDGKIAAIGKNLSAPAATVIDGTGKQLTPGIIDEHSHIAAASINEGGQSVTSEVRIADNLNPDDINIYRELSGGVTTAHILHGSANTIGGQTQLIKLRWGVNDTALKFAGAAPFIKFALGENVKNTRSANNNRFPNTRMGVEEVLMDAFTRARDYEHAIQLYNNRPKNSALAPVRRDLELDALVEIMNKKRFITCHSYKQSEILASMKVADKFGFSYNTFTHVLEGYKLADKLKEHGANVSTFSDWFNYKTEVVDAIPQNANIMFRTGLNVAINSDDAEMARRLNQEAAKSVRYGGMTEEDALKMVTINPATMLHIEKRTGSIKVGKDADLVLWTDDPVSIYAIAYTTIVDGIIYYSRERDQMLRKRISEERNRLIQKMNGEKKSGAPIMRARTSDQVLTGFDEEVGDGENDQSNSN